jgi:hypothetical protein
LLDEVPDLSHGAGEEGLLAHGDNFETRLKLRPDRTSKMTMLASSRMPHERH